MATSMRFFLIACSLIFAVTLFGSARSWLWWSEEKPPAPPPPKPRTTTTPPPTKATTERSQKLNDNKAIEETNKVMERKGTVPARRRQMGIVSQKFNIVIAGYAGAGKSAAVNAFIGKKSGETGSAPEGNSGEITSQPRVYDNAKLHPNISGTKDHKFVYFSVRLS